MNNSKRALLASLLTLSISACQQTSDTSPQYEYEINPQMTEVLVPTPAQMSVDIVTSGRVSKLNHIDIQFVGKNIPYTYSENKIANSPNFYWWVSKHFAIKSDLPVEKVKLYLELLELSYPHYAQLFGAEPANIERQRIAVVYGSSRTKTRDSMFDDGFQRGVHKHAGGETMYYNRAGYSFPSSREQHQRYIVIHETMHAYHMALTGHSTWAPSWITEGLADSIASHVYYPDEKKLAVMVFDRAPMNYIESGLRQYAKANQPSIEAINNDPALKRGLNFFIVHFLLSDPERAHYFYLFRDKLMAANPHSGDTLPTANKLLKQTFPDWDKLEQQFKQFVTELSASFYIASGPWEQDGNSYWIRTYKEDKTPRLDINISNDSQGAMFDFPAPAPSPLLTQNNAAGVVIHYLPEHVNRGDIGFALGLNYGEQSQTYLKDYQGEADISKDSYLSILVKQGQKVAITGVNLEQEYQAFALSDAIQQELKSSLSLGVSTEIIGNNLVVNLSSGKQQQTFNLPLSEQALNAINTGSHALLSLNSNNRITPYFNDGRVYQPSFTASPSNPWHFKQSKALYNAFKTCVEFKLECDKELQSIFALMTNTANHKQAEKELNKLINHLADSDNQALLWSLSGIEVSIEYNQQQVFLRVLNPTQKILSLTSNIRYLTDNQQEIGKETKQIEIAPGINNIDLNVNNQAAHIEVDTQLQWQQKTLSQSLQQTTCQFDGVYLTTTVARSGEEIEITANLTGPYSGNTTGEIRFEVLPTLATKTSFSNHQVSIKPYEHKTYSHRFTITNTSDNLAIETIAELVVDGEDVKLTKLNFIK